MYWVLGISFFAFISTIIREIIKDVEDYDGDKKYYSKPKAIEWFESIGEDELKKRLNAIKKIKPSNAPSRPEMPVIDADKGQVKQASDLLSKGDIDVYKPYSKK